MKIKKIEKQTNNKFLNLYRLYYENGTVWDMSSRNSEHSLVAKTNSAKADAVVIIPYVVENKKTKIILTKEFRYPINDYVWGFPAGLVDKGETEEESALRELKEEIGAEKVSSLERITDACFSSEGMTDESSVVFEATIEKFGKQKLQEKEDIKFFKVEIEKVLDFIKNKKLSVKAAIYLPLIYRIYCKNK